MAAALAASRRDQDKQAPFPVVVSLQNYRGDLDALIQKQLAITRGHWKRRFGGSESAQAVRDDGEDALAEVEGHRVHPAADARGADLRLAGEGDGDLLAAPGAAEQGDPAESRPHLAYSRSSRTTKGGNPPPSSERDSARSVSSQSRTSLFRAVFSGSRRE
jgi:hypothetical protein